MVSPFALVAENLTVTELDQTKEALSLFLPVIARAAQNG